MHRGLTGERVVKMKQRRDPLLEHFCRSLNENVTRVASIKFCARTQSDRRDEMWTDWEAWRHKSSAMSPELFLMEASPGPGTRSRKSREHTREMTLIGKATS